MERPNLRLVIVLIDSRREISNEDMNLLKWLETYSRDYLVVITKADKLSRNELSKRIATFRGMLQSICGHGPIPFSAVTGQGKDLVWREICRHLE